MATKTAAKKRAVEQAAITITLPVLGKGEHYAGLILRMDTSEKAMQEALIEGQRAGQLLLPAGLNPYAPGTLEHQEWERGRLTAIAAYARRVA